MYLIFKYSFYSLFSLNMPLNFHFYIEYIKILNYKTYQFAQNEMKFSTLLMQLEKSTTSMIGEIFINNLLTY